MTIGMITYRCPVCGSQFVDEHKNGPDAYIVGLKPFDRGDIRYKDEPPEQMRCCECGVIYDPYFQYRIGLSLLSSHNDRMPRI
jgi:rubredoxin